MARLRSALPPQEWSFAVQTLPGKDALAVAEWLGEPERARVVQHAWIEGAAAMWNGKELTGREVIVAAVRLADAASARSYLGMLVDLRRKLEEKRLSDPSSFPLQVQFQNRSIDWHGADEAVLTEEQVKWSVMPEDNTTLRMRAGNWVMEFQWRNTPMDQAWAEMVFAVFLSLAGL